MFKENFATNSKVVSAENNSAIENSSHNDVSDFVKENEELFNDISALRSRIHSDINPDPKERHQIYLDNQKKANKLKVNFFNNCFSGLNKGVTPENFSDLYVKLSSLSENLSKNNDKELLKKFDFCWGEKEIKKFFECFIAAMQYDVDHLVKNDDGSYNLVFEVIKKIDEKLQENNIKDTLFDQTPNGDTGNISKVMIGALTERIRQKNINRCKPKPVGNEDHAIDENLLLFFTEKFKNIDIGNKINLLAEALDRTDIYDYEINTTNKIKKNLNVGGTDFLDQVEKYIKKLENAENQTNAHQIQLDTLKLIDVLSNVYKIKDHRDLIIEPKKQSKEDMIKKRAIKLLSDISQIVPSSMVADKARALIWHTLHENDKNKIYPETLMTLNDWKEHFFRDDKLLKANYDTGPTFPNAAYKKNEKKSCYRKINEKYGAVYSENGQIDHVFALNPEVENGLYNNDYKYIPKKISVEQMLIAESRTTDTPDWQMYVYKSLMNMYSVYEIENLYGVNLSEMSIGQQKQFLTFPMSYTEEKDRQELENLASWSRDVSVRTDYYKTLLTLESRGENFIKKIISVLKTMGPFADKIVDAYVKLTDKAEKNAEEIAQLYKDVFFDQKVDKNKIINITLEKGVKIFTDLEEKINLATFGAYKLKDFLTDKENNKKTLDFLYTTDYFRQIVQDTEKNILDETERQQSVLDNIKNIFKQLNEENKKTVFGIDREVDEKTVKFIKDELESSKNRNFPSHFEKGRSYWQDIGEKNKKFDSKRIKEIIDYFKSQCEPPSEKMIKKWGGRESAVIREDVKVAEDNRKYYEPKIKKLEQLLQYQSNLETKLEQLIYGDKIASELQVVALKKYNEIVSHITQGKEAISELFKNQTEIDDTELDKITAALLKEADDMLKKYTDQITQGVEVDEKTMIEELKRYDTDSVFQLNVLKECAKNGVKPEDMKGISFESLTAEQLIKNNQVIGVVEQVLSSQNQQEIPGSAMRGGFTENIDINLSEDEKKSVDTILQMVNLYRNNYRHNITFRDALVKGFIDKLKTGGENTKLYIYKRGDKILAFNRFDDQKNGHKYFGSCNVNPNAQNTKIGEALFKNSIAIEAPNSTVKATVKPFSPATHIYVDKDNFIVEDINDEFETKFVIERYDDGRHYDLKGLSVDQIKSIYDHQEHDLNYLVGKDSFVQHFSSEDEAMITTRQLVGHDSAHKYNMTRYFIDDDKSIYCGFEKLN